LLNVNINTQTKFAREPNGSHRAMNLSRISKKTPHADSRQTLESMHEVKLKEFEEYYAQLPEKRMLLERLKQKALSLPQRVQSNKYAEKLTERMQLKEQIDGLECEIQLMETRDEETKYLLKAAPFLYEYHLETKKTVVESDANEVRALRSIDDDQSLDGDYDEAQSASAVAFGDEAQSASALSAEAEDPHWTASNGRSRAAGGLESFVETSHMSQKGRICDDYAVTCLGYGMKPPKKHNYDQLYCNDCEQYRVLDIKEAIALCTGCGVSVRYQDAQTHTEFSEEIEILSPFAYKRINHFKEWLSQLQAKESTAPSQEVVDMLLVELKKDRVTNISDITHKRIKGYLKKLRLNKQYEHTPALINRLCGVKPPVISKKLEGKLVSMFEEIQKPFEKYCPKSRKNFLSYSYTLHKMCQLLGEDELLPCFPLLKSREKLYLQDSIWKGICEDMRWQYYASI